MKKLIKKYIKINEQVKNLSLSNRIEAKEQASELTKMAAKIHSEILSSIENYIFWYETEGEINIKNRLEVGKMLAICLHYGAPEDIYKDKSIIMLAFRIGNKSMWITIKGEDEFLKMEGEFQEMVSYGNAMNEIQEPTVDMASQELKDFANKFGYSLIAYLDGSFHEQFGIVEVDFDRK